MNIHELPCGEVIMRYRSVLDLRREADEIHRWLDGELEKVDRVADLAKSMLGGGRDDVLAKGASADIQLARADVEAMKAKYPDLPIDTLQSLAPANRMATIMREYTAKMDALDEETRRSRRFNEAWATPLPIGEWSPPTRH
jgi:hypothetical protein